MSADVIHSLFDLIRTSSKWGGLVHGEFVHHVIVPLTVSDDDVVTRAKLNATPDIDKLKFEKVDIWFKSRAELDGFIKEMGELLKPHNRGIRCYHMPKCYHTNMMYPVGSGEVLINLVSSDEFPLEYLHVDCLVYSIMDNRWVVSTVDSQHGNVALLRRQTQHKVAMILEDEFMAVLLKHYDCVGNYNEPIENIVRRYLQQGWTISVPSCPGRLFRPCDVYLFHQDIIAVADAKRCGNNSIPPNTKSEMDRMTLAMMKCNTIHSVFELIRLASKHGGSVFGGFVRDVIVPLSIGHDSVRNESELEAYPEIAKLSFKDVDLWFKSRSGMNSFIAEMAGRLAPSTSNWNSIYPCDLTRMKYSIRPNLPKTVQVDLICSEKCPVNDFDVNCLAYGIVGNTWIANTIHPNAAPVSQLVSKITEKKAVMLPDYFDHMSRHYKSRQSYNGPIDRMVRRYLMQGWSIALPAQPDKFYSLGHECSDAVPFQAEILRICHGKRMTQENEREDTFRFTMGLMHPDGLATVKRQFVQSEAEESESETRMKDFIKEEVTRAKLAKMETAAIELVRAKVYMNDVMKEDFEKELQAEGVPTPMN